MNTTTITSQFQISIPAWLIKEMALKPGDQIVFSPIKNNISTIQVKKVTSLAQLQGSLQRYKKNYPQKLTKEKISDAWVL